MESYQVLADKYVNGHRRGLAFSALPDAPVLAPKEPGVFRRSITRLTPSTPVRTRRPVSTVVPAGRGSPARLG